VIAWSFLSSISGAARSRKVHRRQFPLGRQEEREVVLFFKAEFSGEDGAEGSSQGDLNDREQAPGRDQAGTENRQGVHIWRKARPEPVL
jgi:hypothetical protein